MVEGLLTRWRSAVSVVLAVGVLGTVGWAAAGPGMVGAQSDLDVDEARAKLAELVAENPPLPPGSETPPDGPPCPLATPEQVVEALGGVPVSVEPWYASTAFDAQLQSDVGDRVAVVRCIAAPPAAGSVGFGLFALDIGPFDEVGLDFDRVARRFGAGRPTWTALPDVGGDFVGQCLATDQTQQSCVLLWHDDGLVIGVDLSSLSADDVDVIVSNAGDIIGEIVRDVLGTLIEGLPTTTTSTTTTTSSTSTSTSTTSTTEPGTTSTTTTTEPPRTTTVPPTTTERPTTTTPRPPTSTTTTTVPPTTTSTTTTTEPPTTSTTTTTVPPTTTSTTTTPPPPTSTTTTTAPPTTTSTSTTTTVPPTTTSTTTTVPPTTTSTTTTTVPPTTSTTTTTVPPTTTSTTTTTTTVPPTTTTSTTTTLPPTTLPPTTTTTTTTTTTAAPLSPLWEFIGDDEDLTEFAEAIENAGLVDLFDADASAAEVLASVLPEPLPQQVIDLLGAEEGVTVLAPTNAAMDALPMWDDIVADEVALQHFVLAHVLPGQLDEQEIFATPQVTALSGDVLQIDPATQTINGAHLVMIDQLGSNGIAHTVDAVLVVPPVAPPTAEATATTAPTEAAPAPPTDPAPTPTPPPATGG